MYDIQFLHGYWQACDTTSADRCKIYEFKYLFVISSLKGRLICYILYGLPGYERWWDQSWCQISYSYPGITFLFCIVMPTQFARLEETSAEIQPLSRPEI